MSNLRKEFLDKHKLYLNDNFLLKVDKIYLEVNPYLITLLNMTLLACFN